MIGAVRCSFDGESGAVLRFSGVSELVQIKKQIRWRKDLLSGVNQSRVQAT
ncbi:hypothetical protein [Brenneria alni]|uniref:hypothetical protein n=1 Tax=Brenneria alni TaxID=71656 RepID=UPI001475D10E|nr:hypothetical protein [Brenneria alni]